MNELSLFTGAGGGLLGTYLLGWRPVGYVEWNEYCQRVIAARIADGYLPVAPIFTDVREFVQSGAAAQYRGIADVVTAGFPCQPFSGAGLQLGADDERNMWPATRDAIRAIRPGHVLLENVPGLLACGYSGVVIGDLAALGYVGRWGCISAASQGAPHERDRWWVIGFNADTANAAGNRSANGSHPHIAQRKASQGIQKGDGWKPELGATDACERAASYGEAMRILHGMADRVDRLKALGNGQVPAVVARAWEMLS